MQEVKNKISWWSKYKSHVQKVILKDELEDHENVGYWRNTVFCKILTYLTPLSIIALIPSVFMAFMNGFPVVGIMDLFTFFILIFITIGQGIKIELRKGIVIFILYCLSVILLYYLPLPGPGLLFLLTITIFSSLIYSSAAAYLSAWLNTTIILCFALLIYFGIQSQFVFAGNLGAWLAVSSNLILLSFACAKCLDLLLAGLTASLKENRISKEKLEKANRLYQFISQINQTIVHVKDVDTLFRRSCSIALEFGKYKMAWIGEFDTEQKKIKILDSCGFSEEYINQFTDLPYQANSPHDQVWRTGDYFLCNDIKGSNELEKWKPYADKLGIGSCIVMPIFKSGRIFGSFNLYASELNSFYADDIALLKEVSGDISFALDQFEKAKKHKAAEMKLQSNFEELETITKEQSAILNTLPASIALLDNSGNVIKVNNEWIDFGKANGLHDSYDHINKNYIEVSEKAIGINGKEGEQMAQGLQEILYEGREYFTLEYPCHSPIEKRWFKAEVKPIKGSLLTGAVVMHINISDRKKAEVTQNQTSLALQNAINDLNKIMDSSLDVICAVDAQGTFLKVSAASENVWGYKPEELIGTPIFNILYPEDLQKTHLSAKTVMGGNNLHHFENRYVRKDGTLVPIEWSARWDARAQIRYGVARDVTEKKRLEDAVENERQRFYDLFSEAPSSMGVLSGPNHQFEYVNPPYLQLIGKKDIIGKTVKEILPEAFNQGFVDLLDKVYQTGKTFSSSEMLIQLDSEGTGQLVDKYLNFMYQAHRNENDQIDGIHFFAVDVTEQVVLRKKIEESEEKLKEAQRLLKISNWEVDLYNNIHNWSDEFYHIIEKNREDTTPSVEAFLSVLHPEDFENIHAKVNSIFRKFEAGSFSARIINSNGQIKYIYSEWKFEFDEYLQPIRLYGILQDISERKNAEEEREKLIHDLIQRNQSLEQFTFIISHNLRAPIANIIGLTDHLQDETLTPDERLVFLQGLATSGLGLDTIIKDINSILQVKREIIEKKETISFLKLVSDIQNSLQNIIEKNNVYIETDFSHVYEFFGLRVYFHSIFYNLISNSIKYRKPNKPLLIEIRSKKDNGLIILTFRDNGLGIDLNKNKDKVFGLYNRFHTHVDGKGMGLFMVKSQVEAMGGKISLTSELNQGTEFVIVLDN